MKRFKTLPQALKHGLTRTRSRLHDDEGSLTVEFVVMFPLLVLWFAAAFQFFEAFRSNSQTAKVAYAIADMASREQDSDGMFDGDGNEEIGFRTNELQELFDVFVKMTPRRVNEERLRVSSVCFDDGGTDDDDTDDAYRVLWSWVSDNVIMSPLEDDDIPTSIMPIMKSQDTIIFVEASGRWNPVSTPFYKPGSLVWNNRIAVRPRVFPTGIKYFPDHTNTLCDDDAEEPTPAG